MSLTAEILSNLLGVTLPLQDADVLYIVRPSDAEPRGKKVTFGDIKAAIAGGTVIQNFTTNLFSPLDGEDGVDGFSIPGTPGPSGADGIGIAGREGYTILPDAPEEPIDPLIIPGKDGAAGTQGATGKDGTTILPDLPEEPELPFPLGFPPAPDPLIGSYAPGGFEIPSGKYVDMVGMLQLIGTQQLTGKGNSILRISGNV